MKGISIYRMIRKKGLKLIKSIAMVLNLSALVFLSFACSSGDESTSTVKTQISTVQKGDIALTVTGTGNLALSRSEDLAFEIAGTVAEVLVEESDSVKEGQELARLDTSAFDKQVKTLEKTLETAKRTLTSKQTALTTVQREVTATEVAVKTAEFAVVSAENDLKNLEAVK